MRPQCHRQGGAQVIIYIIAVEQLRLASESDGRVVRRSLLPPRLHTLHTCHRHDTVLRRAACSQRVGVDVVLERLDDGLGGRLHAHGLLVVVLAAHLRQERVVLELRHAEGREARARDAADELAERVGRVLLEEVLVDEDGGARDVGAVGEVLGHAAHGERALLELLGHVVGVRRIARRVERDVVRHVRRHAGEEEHPPRLVDGEGVHALELVLAGRAAEEGGVVVLDADFGVVLLHVRARVDDAVLRDLEDARRLGDVQVAHLGGDDLVDAVLAALHLLRLFADGGHLLLHRRLDRLDVLGELLQRRELLGQVLRRRGDLRRRVGGDGERHPREVRRVVEQQLARVERREHGRLEVGRRSARLADQLLVASLGERLEEEDGVAAQRGVRELRDVVEVVVDGSDAEVGGLGELWDVVLFEAVLDGADGLRRVRLEEQGLPLQSRHKVGEHADARLPFRRIAAHSVRQRHLSVGAHEQHADVELHRDQLVHRARIHVEVVGERGDDRRQLVAGGQRGGRPDGLVRRGEHRLHHVPRERIHLQRLAVALVGPHRRLVDHQHCLHRVELLAEPRARGDVADEHAGVPDDLHVPLTHALVGEAACRLVDAFHSQPQFLLHLSDAL
mmetsp:Transcript_14064/g.31856  ORF Transcript_14064/g.31856 Transcript_14064/m.31856 type:complete len:621 (-) Transcript_14064:787-2649(-)